MAPNDADHANGEATRAGLFQTQTQSLSPPGIVIHDDLYGEHTITEPVLVALLDSPATRRLAGVGQHGITDLLGLTPRVTRLEHSVGAMLLVRSVGGSIPEQVAALLHDISHTVLSHVVDFALCLPGESFHEVHKARYVTTTELPALLAKYGMGADTVGADVLDEEQFPLVEQPAPALCADRLDYGLRDAVAFGKLTAADAQRVFADLRAYPNATDAGRILALGEADLALTLARAYVAADKDVWCSPANVALCARTGGLIGDMMRRGAIDEASLWRLSDTEFWQQLHAAASIDEKAVLDEIEHMGLKHDGSLPPDAKVRTLDPHVVVGEDVATLSVVRPEWKHEREAYIASRRALER